MVHAGSGAGFSAANRYVQPDRHPESPDSKRRLLSLLDVSGLLAWFLWATVHLLYLVSFRSRITVLFTWFYSYLTWGRIARLITFSSWLRRREREGMEPRAAPSASVSAGSAGGSPVPVRAAPERTR